MWTALLLALALQAGTIEGRLLSSKGVPIPRARVWLLELSLSVETDGEGTFVFTGVPPGTYRVLAETASWASEPRLVEVPESSSVEIELIARPEVLRLAEVVSVSGRADTLLEIAKSAAEGVTGREDLQARPIQRPAELLETVPGLVATQHSGSGKANQYFVRGFNLDHGTDFRVTVDGAPVNLPSHGHGQGYADLNFLIPELVERVDYRKGTYYAEEGDFSAAGAARFTLVDRLEDNLVSLVPGQFGYARLLGAGSVRAAGGDLVAALELSRHDGPWVRPDDFRKGNGLVRFTRRHSRGGFRISGQAYGGSWSSTDQIPRRAVSSGELSRFGHVDETDGGSSSRASLSGGFWLAGERSLTEIEAYLVDYDLSLFSNFTYALSDPVNGDQFEQRDDRKIAGFNLSHRWLSQWESRSLENRAGFQLRYDGITNGLFATRARERLSTTREDEIQVLGAAPFAETEIRWSPWLRTVTGLRADLFHADVESDIPLNSGSRSAFLVSPKLALVLGPFQKTELYASFGGGFHSNDARGVTIRIDPVTGEPVSPVPPLVRAWGYDLGVRTDLLPNLHTTASFFGLDLDSELVFVGDAGNTEAGRPSRRLGVELANFFEPYEGIKLDLDLALSRARFRDDDPAGTRIPGAMETVLSAGVTFEDFGSWSGSLRWRYFGPRPLVEDGRVRSESSSLASAQVRYRFSGGIHIGVEVFNLFDAEANDIDYFYASRLPGEPLAGIEDLHFHPVESRSLRLVLEWRF